MLACSCANPACQVLGCQIAKGLRDKYSTAPAPQPMFAPSTAPTQGCQPLPQMTEADIRRIVAEEIAKALAPYVRGLVSLIPFGNQPAMPVSYADQRTLHKAPTNGKRGK